MPDFINVNILKDNSIDQSKKFKGTVYLKKETYSMIESLIALSGGSHSRNDVIEKAIDFLFAYTTSNISQDYLCGVFGSKIEGLVGTLGTRISKGNFRTAVELDMLTRILASEVRLEKSAYDKLRVKSIHNVKTTNGSIDILSASNEVESDNL